MKRTPIPLATIAFEGSERSQLSLKEASKLTGVPVSQFRRLAREGKFNPITGFGRKWYITAADLTALMNRKLRGK